MLQCMPMPSSQNQPAGSFTIVQATDEFVAVSMRPGAGDMRALHAFVAEKLGMNPNALSHPVIAKGASKYQVRPRPGSETAFKEAVKRLKST
jgi:hypothetical protein